MEQNQREKSDVLIGEFVNAIVDIPHPSLQQCIGNDWVDASTPLDSSAIREAWITRCLEIDSFMLGSTILELLDLASSKDQIGNIVSGAKDAGSSILRAWNSWDNPVDRMVFCAAAMATIDRKKRRHVQEVAAILDPYNWHSQTYLFEKFLKIQLTDKDMLRPWLFPSIRLQLTEIAATSEALDPYKQPEDTTFEKFFLQGSNLDTKGSAEAYLTSIQQAALRHLWSTTLLEFAQLIRDSNAGKITGASYMAQTLVDQSRFVSDSSATKWFGWIDAAPFPTDPTDKHPIAEVGFNIILSQSGKELDKYAPMFVHVNKKHGRKSASKVAKAPIMTKAAIIIPSGKTVPGFRVNANVCILSRKAKLQSSSSGDTSPRVSNCCPR